MAEWSPGPRECLLWLLRDDWQEHIVPVGNEPAVGIAAAHIHRHAHLTVLGEVTTGRKRAPGQATTPTPGDFGEIDGASVLPWSRSDLKGSSRSPQGLQVR